MAMLLVHATIKWILFVTVALVVGVNHAFQVQQHLVLLHHERLATSRQTQGGLYLATSSSELKKRMDSDSQGRVPDIEADKISSTTSNGKAKRKAPVAKRLMMAAKRAAERKKAREAEERKEEFLSDGVDERPPLASLQQLTQAIDKRLLASQKTPDQWNRDSMTSVVRHNEQTISDAELALSSSKGGKAQREVAIVLAKPLKNDQITLEYANRIRRLVRAMLSEEEEYRPDVICFVGGQSPGNILADSDAGYMYFQFLTAAHDVSTEGIDIHLVKGSVEDGALQQIAFFLQETCVPAWLRTAKRNSKRLTAQRPTTMKNGKNSTRSSDDAKTAMQDRLRVHFSLISSEYELCQLNDIHLRSPGTSVLRSLESWSQRSFTTSWSYVYVTTVQTADDATPAQSFCAKTFKTAQQLLPVIKNLQNVVNNREFFQTESYRVLVAARRSLVSDMESLYEHQPQLRAVHNLEANGSSSRPVDVALESALLLLGRCVDVVRPAGLLTGAPVSQEDWKLALIVLSQAYETIKTVCDPDRPLLSHEWIKLGDDIEGNAVVQQ